LLLVAGSMGVAFDFDTELVFCAVEVCNEAPRKNVLTTNVHSELVVAQALL
jgi:hypothetical protein